LITSYATPKGTKRYLDKHQLSARTTPWFSTSPIAIGTHLGEMNEADSILYREAIEHALTKGINFVDTAINYRGMRSERDVGYALTRLIGTGIIRREDIVISTKAGIIPGDIEANLIPSDYLEQVLYKNDIIQKSDLNIVDTHRHVLAPSYYEFAIRESRKHLNLETIDIYYVHNPEISMKVLGPNHFYQKIERLFEFLENQVQKGTIRFYGMATWTGLRSDQNSDGYLSLEKTVEIAKKVGGENHHFKFIQLPYNQKMPEANGIKNQTVNRDEYTVYEAAEKLGLYTMTSAPFNLGKLVTEEMNANTILSDILQTKGIFSTMVGMKNVENVKRNLVLVRRKKGLKV
jgi:aryl-alcohol dehydrogenase-like predicted oxidoreductase